MITSRLSGFLFHRHCFGRYKSHLNNVLLLLAAMAIALATYFGAGQNLAHAQSEGEGQASTIQMPDPMTPEAIEKMVSRMSDEQVRQLLLERLDAVAKEKQTTEEAKANASPLDLLKNAANAFASATLRPIVEIPQIFSLQGKSFATFGQKIGQSGFFDFLWKLIVAIAAGLIAEFAANRFAVSFVSSRVKVEDSSNLWTTLRFLLLRLLKSLIGLLVFIVVARSVGGLLFDKVQGPYAHDVFLYLLVLPRAASAFLHFVYAPKKPEFRLLNVTDAGAKFLTRHQVAFFVLICFSGFLVTFNTLNGVTSEESRIGAWFLLAAHAYLLYIVWNSWSELINMTMGKDRDDLTHTEVRVARAYPWFLMVLIIGTWILSQILAGLDRYDLLASGAQYWTLIILSFAPLADTAIRGLVRHLVPPMTGTGPVAEMAHASTKRSYIRIGRVVAFGLAMLWIAKLWDVKLINVASAGVGAQIAANLIQALIIIAAGYLVWEITTLLINRKLASEQTAAGVDPHAEGHGGGEGGGGGGGSSRLSTVLPIVRFILQVVIIVMTILLALSNIGIDITPLVAGAGILGLAVGFGAQTFVRDVVSGMFFLIEDAFRVGEYLNIGGTVGTVEKISLRSLQLRHHAGPVHTIPYGEIPRVTNNSRDWVIMKLKFTFPFDTDANRIKKIFKKVGQDMLEAEYADDLIETFKSQGVYDVDDVGIVIRGKFMAKPGTQWVMRKDIYSRIQKELDAAGISFARREVRVQIPGLENSDDLNDEQKSAIGAAAAEAAKNDGPKPPMPDTP